MNRSESIKELATALAKAQAEMAGAKKVAENGAFKNSKYADLASVWDAARPALTKYGLSVVQFTTPSERNEIQVETTVMHSSGEWVSGVIAIPVDKLNAHGYGSALTYARRFSLAAAVGIAPEDDDGNAAAQAAPSHRRTSEEGGYAGASRIGYDTPVGPSAELKAAAEKAADDGTQAFREYYAGIAKTDRAALAPIMSDIQKRAEAADQAKPQLAQAA